MALAAPWTGMLAVVALGGVLHAQDTLELRRAGGDRSRPVVFALEAAADSPEAEAQVVLPPGEDLLRVARPMAARPHAGAAPAAAAPEGAPVSDWLNYGGTSGRNGRSTQVGPGTASPLWSGGRPSIISWLPVTSGNRLFLVRQTAFPEGEPGASPVVAMNLTTGAELWAAHIPFNPGDWTTWIAGVRDGRVYASRSGNGSSVAAKMYALDAVTGAVLWISADTTTAGAYDGVVFAPDGDLVVGSFTRLMRLNAEDGATVWSVPRSCRVSGSCGGVVHGAGVYIADTAAGFNNVVVKHDLATGARLYESPLLLGFTQQDVPFVGADGTVYFARTQNNVSTDFLYALTDNGSALVSKWTQASAWMTNTVQAARADGSVYTMAPGYSLVRRSGATGAVLATAPAGPAFDNGVRMALDADDKLYVSEGFSALRVYDAGLGPLWNASIPNLNIGGPSLGAPDTLVVTGVGTDVRAYREVVPVELMSFQVD